MLGRITIALVIATTGAVVAADLSGAWRVRTNFEWLAALDCTFTLTANAPGSCRVGDRALELREVATSNGDASWSMDAEGSAPGGGTVRYLFTGKFEDDSTIRGKVLGRDLSGRFPDQSGNFSATRTR